MKVDRIERFVVTETNLIGQIIGELCRKFFAAVDFCQTGQQNISSNECRSGGGNVTPTVGAASAPEMPVKSRTIFGTSISSSFASVPANKESRKAPASPIDLSNPIDSFLKVLKFCNTMIIVISSKTSVRGKTRNSVDENGSSFIPSIATESSMAFPSSPNPVTPRFRRMYMSPESKKRADPDEQIDFRLEFLQVYLDTFLTSALLPALGNICIL